MQEFRELKVEQQMDVAVEGGDEDGGDRDWAGLMCVVYGTERFGFGVRLMRAHSQAPNNCALFLELRRCSRSSNIVTVIFDVVCTEMRCEVVNTRKRFKHINDNAGIPFFSNRRVSSLDCLTISICVRIVEVE